MYDGTSAILLNDNSCAFEPGQGATPTTGEQPQGLWDPYTYAGHLVMFPSGYGFYDLYGRAGIHRTIVVLIPIDSQCIAVLIRRADHDCIA